MENIKELERIIKENATVGINGKTYSEKLMHIIVDDRTAKSISVNSLTAMTSYLSSNVESHETSDIFIQVIDERTVVLFGVLDKETKVRQNIMEATAMRGLAEFQFDRFYPLESFLIKMATLFRDSPDRQRVTSFVSKIDVKGKTELNDDGVSQNVTVNKVISGAIKASEGAPSIVKLCPFRTFLAVSQPESTFMFRVREQGGAVESGLFEADGGMWKIEAMASISEWLKKNTKNIDVIC